MKVVFPCKGALVLLKQDLEILNAFYNTSLLTSNVLEYYKTSNSLVQVRNFNYIPPKNGLVLYKANLLSIERMRKILGIYKKSEPNAEQNLPKNTSLIDNTSPISDDDLLSNPFFQTLKPL